MRAYHLRRKNTHNLQLDASPHVCDMGKNNGNTFVTCAHLGQPTHFTKTSQPSVLQPYAYTVLCSSTNTRHSTNHQALDLGWNKTLHILIPRTRIGKDTVWSHMLDMYFKCKTEPWLTTGLIDTPFQRGKFISNNGKCHRSSCSEPRQVTDWIYPALDKAPSLL